MNKSKPQTLAYIRRVVFAVAGSIVLVAGILMIPYPGPGWVVVFAGLAILAREFAWARRILERLRKRYDQWNAWIARQNLWIQLTTLTITAIVVVITVWLVNGFGFVKHLLGFGWDWLVSPFAR